jgi:hypothetical protein
MQILIPLVLFLSAALPQSPDEAAFGRQVSASGIRHSFVISGPKTVLVNESSAVEWSADMDSRDATRLANGNFLVVRGKHAVELDSSKKELWRYDVSAPNTELMGGQRLADGKTLITELGPKPRLVEVDATGKVVLQIPIQPETDNSHMQSRMSRKLKGGTYLVPHRLMPFTKEYDASGKVLKVLRTDMESLGGAQARNGNFCAVRLPSGNTLITCTTGNKVVELDPEGKPVWVVESEDVEGLLNDVCGLQVLKNGNVLVSSYGNQKETGVKMLEITREKKVVWKFYAPTVRYVHTLQILTTNGKPE